MVSLGKTTLPHIQNFQIQSKITAHKEAGNDTRRRARKKNQPIETDTEMTEIIKLNNEDFENSNYKYA